MSPYTFDINIIKALMMPLVFVNQENNSNKQFLYMNLTVLFNHQNFLQCTSFHQISVINIVFFPSSSMFHCSCVSLILFRAIYAIVSFSTKFSTYLLYEYFKSHFYRNLQYQGRYVHKQTWPKINLIKRIK